MNNTPVIDNLTLQPEKIISNFIDLSLDEVAAMAKAIRNGTVYFSHVSPSAAITPIGAYDFLFTNDYYRSTYNDEQATWQYLLLCFKTADDQVVKLPISIYGISPAHKIRSCLVTLRTLAQLLKMNEDDLQQLVGLESEAALQTAWADFTRSKRQLITLLFSYYMEIADGNRSTMDWKARGKESLTRLAALSIPDVIRIEDSVGQEYYFKNGLDEASIEFLKECAVRKRQTYENKELEMITRIPFANYPPVTLSSLKTFYKNLVD